jgi:hypothetical protein
MANLNRWIDDAEPRVRVSVASTSSNLGNFEEVVIQLCAEVTSISRLIHQAIRIALRHQREAREREAREQRATKVRNARRLQGSGLRESSSLPATHSTQHDRATLNADRHVQRWRAATTTADLLHTR